MGVLRCFTEKRPGFDAEARTLLDDLRGYLGIKEIETLRILSRYDVEGISEETFTSALETVFSEPQTDDCYVDEYPVINYVHQSFAVEALPGQYDQRADACSQCLLLLALSDIDTQDINMQNISESGESSLHVGRQSENENTKETNAKNVSIKDDSKQTASMKPDGASSPTVNTAKVYILGGSIKDEDIDRIKQYLINTVDSREASIEKPETLAAEKNDPDPVASLSGFISISDVQLLEYVDKYGLAMDFADLCFLRDYFRDTEKRDPTVAELRVIDTYWSDHCRHTTFNTSLTGVSISNRNVQAAYDDYLLSRHEVYGDDSDKRPQTLMDIATIAAKTLQRRGLLKNLDISDEVNACSIRIEAEVNGKTEDWLVMFKNETHNHPTEVEPFGGAATCLSGAIRDPLSGRAYVYQAMRITGSGDPRSPLDDTLPGKLPQRKLTLTAARGYSSYGNQIGLPAGLVQELYHPGYTAKRLELGAVVGAVRADRVKREKPAPGDKVVLLGGRTGRDGIGGATGSSKTQSEHSLATMASEVQKGNAPEERKLQRLFLDAEVTRLIKRCNDFGAGGVSVAVGELADGIDIDLSLVRLKYEGLSGTEIAISESQERMAVVVAPGDVEKLIKKAAGENIEAYVVAEVTELPRVRMRHKGKVIVDISREFLSTNGAVKTATVLVKNRAVAEGVDCEYDSTCAEEDEYIKYEDLSANRLREIVCDLRYCSQRGLYEMFDGTVGAGSILMKNGGKTQSTPVQAMAALLPVGYDIGESLLSTTTCSVMSFGFDPYLSSQDPFNGARTAVITSVAKLVATGCDPKRAYLTFQEYFGRLQGDPVRWGEPFSALLGAYQAQMELGIAAIGGKDSMSGTFNLPAGQTSRQIRKELLSAESTGKSSPTQDSEAVIPPDTVMHVPPTLVSFALAPNEAKNVISPEFKATGHEVVLFKAGTDGKITLMEQWGRIRQYIESGKIVAAWAVTGGGVLEGIFKMAIGNEIGFEIDGNSEIIESLTAEAGSIIAEMTCECQTTDHEVLIGHTIAEPVIILRDETLLIDELKREWENVLENVFPTQTKESYETGVVVEKINYDKRSIIFADRKFASPRALILSFPGTNCEIDTARAIQRAGGIPRILVVGNLTSNMLVETIEETARAIKESQMVIIPGGFSLGDEPDGSAKFITVFFRNRKITDAITGHLENTDGLMLGICNGFQALVKLGLVPFGEIVAPEKSNPTLTFNIIGRHQARYVYTTVASVASPWMCMSNVGDVHAIAISHGEGRFVASSVMLNELVSSGRVATQYTDSNGEPAMNTAINPNGSLMSIEGLFSPDGRVFGKMGHTERIGEFVAGNIYGNMHQPIFESGISYFR